MTGGRKLAVYVTAPGEGGRMVTFSPGTVVSPEVAKGITSPGVWADEPEGRDESVPAKAPAKRAASSKK